MSRRTRFLDRLTAILAAFSSLGLLLPAAFDQHPNRFTLAVNGLLILTLAARIAVGCQRRHRDSPERPKVMVVRVTMGEPRDEWCNDCLVTHTTADVLRVTDHGVSVIGQAREQCRQENPS